MCWQRLKKSTTSEKTCIQVELRWESESGRGTNHPLCRAYQRNKSCKSLGAFVGLIVKPRLTFAKNNKRMIPKSAANLVFLYQKMKRLTMKGEVPLGCKGLETDVGSFMDDSFSWVYLDECWLCLEARFSVSNIQIVHH